MDFWVKDHPSDHDKTPHGKNTFSMRLTYSDEGDGTFKMETSSTEKSPGGETEEGAVARLKEQAERLPRYFKELARRCEHHLLHQRWGFMRNDLIQIRDEEDEATVKGQNGKPINFMCDRWRGPILEISHKTRDPFIVSLRRTRLLTLLT